MPPSLHPHHHQCRRDHQHSNTLQGHLCMQKLHFGVVAGGHMLFLGQIQESGQYESEGGKTIKWQEYFMCLIILFEKLIFHPGQDLDSEQ